MKHVIAAVVSIVSLSAAPADLRLRDLNDRLVDPFRSAPNTRATVFVFVGTDCPISNRYAPKVRQLFETFTARGVAFWLVYPDPSDTPAAIRAHVKAFGYPERVLRDPQHALVERAQVRVTPEAAVYDGRGVAAYRGRIDNRYVSLGVERPSPTSEDLEEAITAVLTGQRVRMAVTEATGCFIADWAQQPPSADAPGFRLVATIKDIMNGIVDPPADRIWSAVWTEDSAAGIIHHEPKTDEEWTGLEHDALVLAEAANLLKMPGRLVARPEEQHAKSTTDPSELTPAQISERIARGRQTFVKFADLLQDASGKALDAARAKTPKGIFDAGQQIYKACVACHSTYWYPGSSQTPPVGALSRPQ